MNDAIDLAIASGVGLLVGLLVYAVLGILASDGVDDQRPRFEVPRADEFCAERGRDLASGRRDVEVDQRERRASIVPCAAREAGVGNVVGLDVSEAGAAGASNDRHVQSLGRDSAAWEVR